jgi:drug/metabolite transporter (DMT)-like permease
MLSQPGLLSGLMLASGWCNTAFILAVLDGQVVRVMLLFYLSPVWAVLLARIMLGERLPPRAMVTLSLAMSGALIILWQPSLGVPWPRGHADWLAISSGLAFAFSNVLIRKAQDLSVAFKALVSWAGVVLLSGVLVMAGMGGAPVWNITAVAVAVGLGIGGIALMSACLVYGVSNMPVHRSTVILLFEVLVGAVSAQWWAGEVLGWREWFGGVLILAAAWFAGRQQLQD